MSKTFIYEQGWLVEKPEMKKPDGANFYEMFGNTRGRWKEREFVIAEQEYQKHLTTLRRFKYDYPDLGKELELGKDFEVTKRCSVFIKGNYSNKCVYCHKIFKNTDKLWFCCQDCCDEVIAVLIDDPAIPITKRTYSEQDLIKLLYQKINALRLEVDGSIVDDIMITINKIFNPTNQE